MTWYNELWDGVVFLAIKAFTPLHMCEKPLIHTLCAMTSVKDQVFGQLRGRVPSHNNPPIFKEDFGKGGG